MIVYIVYIAFALFAVGLVTLESFLKNKTIKLVIFLSLLIGYLSLGILKGSSVGLDTANYSHIYESAKLATFKDYVITDKLEYGYYASAYLFSASLKLPEIIFNAFNFLVIGVFLFLTFCHKERKTLYLTLFLFAGFFCMSFSGVRQSVAISICTFAFFFYFESKSKTYVRLLVFYLLVTIAFLYHKSSIVLFIVPLITLIDLEFYQTPFVPLLLLLFFPILLSRIYIIVITNINQNSIVFDSRLSLTLVMEVVFIIIMYFLYNTSLGKRIRDKFNISDLNFGKVDSRYMWLVYLGCVFMCLNYSSTIATRFSMFFYLGIVYFVVKITDTIQKPAFQRVYIIGISALLGVYFVYSTPVLGLVPYVFR